MTADAVLNAYIDANILLLFAAGIWLVVRAVLARTPLRHAFSAQLQMVYGALLTVALAPLVLFGAGLARQSGLIGGGYGVSLTDFAVSQYLSGNIDMAPTRFEMLLTVRNSFTHEVTTLSSGFGIAVAAGLAFGAAWFGLRFARDAWRIRGLIGRSYVWRRVGGVDIRLTDETDVPFSTRGLRQRYVVVPSALLSQTQDLRIAVAHELQHMRQNDLGWEILLEALRPLFFWNPAFSFWKHEVEKMRELACDQKVLTQRAFGVRAYSDCLLRVCKNSLRRNVAGRSLAPSVPFAQIDASHAGSRSARFLRYRVLSMLADARQGPGRALTLVMILALAGTIIVGSAAVQRPSDWSQDRLMLAAIVNLERLQSRNDINR